VALQKYLVNERLVGDRFRKFLKTRKKWPKRLENHIYREIATEMGIECPKQDYKTPEVFIDKKGFDPSDPVGYLNSFEIRLIVLLCFTCLNWRRYLRYLAQVVNLKLVKI